MIYICFGMTKSASTFLCQLIEETFRAAGRSPARLGPPLLPRLSIENYFDFIDPALLSAASDQVGERDVVLKTHQVLHPEVGARIDAGLLLACASIRDPREIALAMVDHGRRARRVGWRQFSECRTVYDALPSIDYQVENFRRWSALTTLELFLYNEICFDTAATATRLARQIGVAVDLGTVLAPFRDGALIGQFNQGAALRYQEMPAEQQAVFLDRYAELYREFQFDTPAAEAAAGAQKLRPPAARGHLGRVIGDVRRWLRS